MNNGHLENAMGKDSIKQKLTMKIRQRIEELFFLHLDQKMELNKRSKGRKRKKISVEPVVAFKTDDIEAHNQKSPKEETLFSALKPLLWCLRLCGVLYNVDLKSICCQNKACEGAKRKCFSPILVYNILVILLLWTNFALSLLPFQYATSFDGVVCNQIITATWFLQVACVATNNLICSNSWGKIFEQWDFCLRFLEYKKDLVFVRRYSILAVIVYAFWVLLEFSFLVLGSYLLTGMIPGAHLSGNPSVDPILQAMLFTIFFYFASSWYLLSAVFVILGMGIYRFFRHFHKTFVNALTDDGKLIGDIEQFRLQHGSISRLVGVTDDLFSMYVFMTISTVIPLIILTLYFMLFEKVDLFTSVATWWSVAMSILQLISVFITGGLVNHRAHYTLNSLYGINLNGKSPEECHKMSVFLNQLTSHSIGFTAFGLFAVDKPTIITFAGSIVTYAVVVIQFKPSDTSGLLDSVVCNCSCF